MLDNARIFAIAQAAVALIALIGGGVLIVLVPEQANASWGVIGLVVGYFFREASGAHQAVRQYDAVAQSKKNGSGD